MKTHFLLNEFYKVCTWFSADEDEKLQLPLSATKSFFVAIFF
ncbi:MAG: hypothetical protein ACE5R3_05175 [Nitrosopumilaceae archaeon]